MDNDSHEATFVELFQDITVETQKATSKEYNIDTKDDIENNNDLNVR